MTNTGTKSIEVHLQGHTATYSKAELESKSLISHLMLYFYSHIHPVIQRFPHSLNNGIAHKKYVSENIMHWPCKRKEWNI